MEMYQQIINLAKAAEIIHQLLPFVNAEHSVKLIEIADSIAEIAIEIEGVE